MKSRSLHAICLSTLFLSLLSSCAPAPQQSPTLTTQPSFTSTTIPASTPTARPTNTATPTIAPSSTPTPRGTPTPECPAANGRWQSNEESDFYGPILTFSVQGCQITSWEIWVFPLPGELVYWTGGGITLTDASFKHVENSEMGSFTLQGQFDAPTSSYGSLFFPRGFSIFGTILKKDVTIPWTASK